MGLSCPLEAMFSAVLIPPHSLLAIALITTASAAPIISEIHYHPPHAERTPEPVADEFIEIHNPDATAIDISGWSFTNGISYTFPAGTSLASGAYLAITPASWTGRLSNSGERITLSDASGETIDSLSYADGADWADLRPGRRGISTSGWEWDVPHDGEGFSLERTSTASNLPSDTGQLWRASTLSGGTPGAPNSVASTNVAPLLLDVAHSPAIPIAGQPVTVSVRILDEDSTSITATLHYRDASSETPPSFTRIPLLDDGFAGDLTTGDGIYSALIPGSPTGTITEFYVAAADGANYRTWPGSTSDAGAQEANALFQSIDPADLPTTPSPTGHYRLVTTAAELATFDATSSSSDAPRNATFVSLRNGETQVRYRTFFRIRGNGSRRLDPPPIKLFFPPGQPHDGLANTNLGSYNTALQHLGMHLARASGIRAPRTRLVRLSFNGTDRSVPDDTMFGQYIEVVPLDSDFAKTAFPDGGDGNMYRKRSAPGDRDQKDWGVHLGIPIYDQPDWYDDDGWDKQTNGSQADYSDLQAFVETMHESDANDPSYLSLVGDVIHTQQWIRWFAFNTLLGSRETALSNGIDDDYALYRPKGAPRFQLIPHDFDTILHTGLDEESTLFPMIEDLSRIKSDDRILQLIPFFAKPEIEAPYFADLRELSQSTFAEPAFSTLARHHLPTGSTSLLSDVADYAVDRATYVLTQATGTTPAPILSISSTLPAAATYHVSTTPTTTISITTTGAGIDVAGTIYTGQTANAPVTLIPGFNRISITALDAANHPLLTHGIDIFYDNTQPGIHISEIIPGANGTFTVEITNTSNAPISGTTYYLSDDADTPQAYPINTLPPPGGYTLIQQEFSGSYIQLRSNTLIDSTTFNLPSGHSLSRAIGWHLSTPTPGAANSTIATTSAAPGNTLLNEWLPAPRPSFKNEFIELHAPDSQAIALGGLELTDDALNTRDAPARHLIPHHTFIAPGSYTIIEPAFGISTYSEHIALITKDRQLIDQVFTTGETDGTTSGRSPTDSSEITTFTTPTPGAPNGTSSATPLLTALRVTEISADAGDLDFIEFFNAGTTPLDLTGVRISNGINFTFPSITLDPGSYTTVVEDSSIFTASYPSAPTAGQYSGGLSANEDTIKITPPGPKDTTPSIARFTYLRSWYPGATHYVAAHPDIPPAAYGKRESWRPATGALATPGAASSATIISPTRLRAPVSLPFSHTPAFGFAPSGANPFSLAPGAPAWLTADPTTGTLSGTPTEKGILSFTYQIGALQVPYSLTITEDYSAYDSFASWATANSVANDPDADLDSDGLSLLIEYIFGLSPFIPEDFPAPVISTDSVKWSFPRANSPTGIELTLDVSSDLTPGSWTSTLITTPPTSITAATEDSRLFYRFSATKLP